MPIVHSVSDITSILSGIIRHESVLRDVRVQGEVSVDNRPDVFWLRYEENIIRCFIPNNNAAQFTPLLTEKNIVVVSGDITLFPLFSEYQILVKDVQPIGVNAKENSQILTVSSITNRLEEITTSFSEIQQIHVRGEITHFELRTDQPWYLSNSSDSASDSAEVAKLEQKIHCFFNPNSTTSVNKSDAVCIQGAIRIWGPSSRYQICVQQIESNDRIAHCRCSGCAQCLGANRCNRPREIANFESCARCLPHPSDELYALCPECYAVSVDHENKVKAAVYDYLDELHVNGFSPYKEYQIQFGTRNGYADVVLTDGNRRFAAIAECKGAGYVGHGIQQLKSYLSATDTRFGVFANRTDPKHWEFYENRRRNRFYPINRFEFKKGVVEGIVNRERLRDEIANLNGEIARLENQKSELHTAIGQVSQTKHNLTERTSNLTQQIETLENYKSELHKEIHRKLNELLEEKMQRLERSLSDLKIELQKQGIVNWFKNLFSKENR